jgi:hypothetical protein
MLKTFLVVLSLAAVCLSLPLATPSLPDSHEAEITIQITQTVGDQLLVVSQGFGRVGVDAQKKSTYVNLTMESISNDHKYNTIDTIISRYDMSPAKVFELKRAANKGPLSCTSALINGTFETFNNDLSRAKCSNQKSLVDGRLVQFCNGTFSSGGLNGNVQLGIENVAGKYVPYIAYQSLPSVNITQTIIFTNFVGTTPNSERYPFTIPDICNHNSNRAATPNN